MTLHIEGGTSGERLPDVDVREVSKSFGDITAVDNVSFRVARGEFYSLLGPSGCGKTTYAVTAQIMLRRAGHATVPGAAAVARNE